MLTNNAYISMLSRFLPDAIIDPQLVTATNGSHPTSYTNLRGLGFNFAISSATLKTSINETCIVLGDGDATPTINDYNLSGNLITGIVSSTSTVRKPNGVEKRFTVTNNNSNEIIIKEICYFSQGGWSSDLGSTSGTILLLDRTVLDTPVTIPAGGVGQVVYTITFNYPTAT